MVMVVVVVVTVGFIKSEMMNICFIYSFVLCFPKFCIFYFLLECWNSLNYLVEASPPPPPPAWLNTDGLEAEVRSTPLLQDEPLGVFCYVE